MYMNSSSIPVFFLIFRFGSPFSGRIDNRFRGPAPCLLQQQGACGYDELPPADPLILDLIAQETMRTVNIDGVPREIRFYGNTAVVMLACDDPREISFHGGARKVTFGNRETVLCSLNNTYRECIVHGSTHRLVINTFIVTFIKVSVIIGIVFHDICLQYQTNFSTVFGRCCKISVS
jgi:hypothetical protein